MAEGGSDRPIGGSASSMRRGVEKFHLELLQHLPEGLPLDELGLPNQGGEMRRFVLDPVRNIGYAPFKLGTLRTLVRNEIGKNALRRWVRVGRHVVKPRQRAFRHVANLHLPGDPTVFLHFGGRALGIAFVKERLLLKICDDDEVRMKDLEREAAVGGRSRSQLPVRALDSSVASEERINWLLFPLLPERRRVVGRKAWGEILRGPRFTRDVVEFYRANELAPYDIEDQLSQDWQEMLKHSPGRSTVDLIQRLHSEIRRVTDRVGTRTAFSAVTHGDLRPGHVWDVQEGYRVIDWGKAARRNVFYDVYKQEIYQAPDPGVSLANGRSPERAVYQLSQGWYLPFARQLEAVVGEDHSPERIWQNVLLCASTNAREIIQEKNEIGDRTLRLLQHIFPDS